ncbi:MAG: hypothetical protein H6509_15780 [Bryobacterales bacterium]|nr:hypothetical protein [Bryobacterales bacterium]
MVPAQAGPAVDILAHFLVFERDLTTGKSIKRCCYQQFRAGEQDRLTAWWRARQARPGVAHPGSGKSLTMVYAAAEAQDPPHARRAGPRQPEPALVLTDRIQLDDQIAATFEACGCAPRSRSARRRLLDELCWRKGLTLLPMIFKFDKSTGRSPTARTGSSLVDECHRTQEKDLRPYPRRCPRRFRLHRNAGEKNDHDTYANLGAPGEGYLTATRSTTRRRWRDRADPLHGAQDGVASEGREIDIPF